MSRHAAAVELRALLRLAAPLMAGQVLLFGSNLVDTLLAGHLGPVVLGAVAIGGSVWMVPLMAMQGIMYSVPARISRLVGAGLRHEAGFVFRQALWLALFAGLVMLLAVRLSAPGLVGLLQVPSDLQDGLVDFLRAVSLGAPALGAFMACRGLSDALSMTRPAIWFGLLGIALLVPIGFLLMYGGFGFAGLGAYGSGLATALVIWLQAACFLLFVSRARAYRDIGWSLGRMGPERAALAGLLTLGLPMAASVVMEVSLFSGAAFAIARFGAIPVAAHQIALNVAGLAFMMPLGLAGAITVRVGLAMGRGSLQAARLAGMLGIGVALATQSVSCLVMVTLPSTIAAIYSNDVDVQAATVSLLALAALFQLSDGVQVAANGALRGMQDTRLPALITLFAYWVVGMPIGLLLAFPAGLAARGMWMGLFVGLSVAAVLLTWRFRARTVFAIPPDGVTAGMTAGLQLVNEAPP